MLKTLLLPAAALLFLTGCTSAPFEASESDKLTAEEQTILTAHARHFLTSQSKHLQLNPDELEIINHTQPRLKAVYTASKEGRLSIGWEMPDKQVFAIANGPMMNTRDWKISVTNKSKVTYIQKQPGKPSSQKPLTTEDFKDINSP